MAVIHVFKDGTTTSSLKNVYVPKEIVESVVAIAQHNEETIKKAERKG